MRFTRERAEILRGSCSAGGHFVVEALAKRVGVSVATVYRNLPLMVEAGIIRRTVDTPDGRGAYEHVWGREHHDHLVCVRCGEVVEFHFTALEVLQEHVAQEHGFALMDHRMELLGLCPRCQEEET
ncbi:MAG: transcriptional repressor [Deltaproteobacteria bacterium]|nr:transcriptional repressor [Deltaproteobacteria bacterium]